MNRIILLGGGGHCKVVIDNLQISGKNIVGILDDNPEFAGSDILGCKIIGGMECLSEIRVKTDYAVIAVTDPRTRKKLAQKCIEAGLEMTGFIHPSAVISDSATISSTAQICAGTIINPLARIEENVIINTQALIEHDCLIGSFSHIAPSASLLGNVKVGALTMIGASTVVNPNLRIGSSVVVGAGSVVVSNLEDRSNYRGVPAKRTK